MNIQSKGNILLELMEEAIAHADINCRNAAKSAYYGIERTVEALYNRKKNLEEAWKDRKKILEQSMDSCKLDSEIKVCAQWLLTDGEKYLASLKTCSLTEELTIMLQKHHDFNELFENKHKEAKKLISDGQKLIQQGHFDVAAVKYMISKLDRLFISFQMKLDHLRNLMEQSLTFYESVKTVTESLEKITAKLDNKTNDLEKAKYRKEAIQISSLVLREGQLLLKKTNDVKVAELLKKLNNVHKSIMAKTDGRQFTGDADLSALNSEIEIISNWITNIGENFLDTHTIVGDRQQLATTFLNEHQQLLAELANYEKELLRIKSSNLEIQKKKKKNELSDKIESLQIKFSSLSERIKHRINIVTMMIAFIDHTDEILKSIFLLEEELTSNQSNENVDASITTINRQKQEKEEIINRAEVLQEEGQRILDDLSLCASEKTLDQGAIKMKIGKELKSIVVHSMQLEELWDQRESQLDSRKRLSTQFFDFEKEIRKVINGVHNEKDDIIQTFVNENQNGFRSIQLEEKLQQFKSVAKIASGEIENIIKEESKLQSDSKSKLCNESTTNHLTLTHQKLKTKLSKYEVLHAMYSTFYTSVEKFVTYMNELFQDYLYGVLPRTVASAQYKLKDHSMAFNTFEQLFSQTIQSSHFILEFFEPTEITPSVIILDGVKSSEEKNTEDNDLQFLIFLQELFEVFFLTVLFIICNIRIINSQIIYSSKSHSF